MLTPENCCVHYTRNLGDAPGAILSVVLSSGLASCSVRRWLPERQLVVVADSSFAALELLFALSQMKSPLHVVTRLREEMLHCINHLRPVNLSRWDVLASVGKRLPTLKVLIENPYTPSANCSR